MNPWIVIPNATPVVVSCFTDLNAHFDLQFEEAKYSFLGETLISCFFFLAQMSDAQARKLKRMEELRKKPTVTPDWKALMKDIDGFRYGHTGKLKKVVCSDRSKPMLSKMKVQGKVSKKFRDGGP